MKPRVYIETTVVSYLTARPSREALQEGRRQLTVDWWTKKRTEFEFIVSPLVFVEAGKGDVKAATARVEAIKNLPILALDDRARSLARALIAPGAIPGKATDDAAHIAICSVNSIPYLLTWNFKHIANAAIRLKLDYLCAINGYKLPTICTPEEL
ncbi:MAG: type II toxin-antitoxin system VapC family toxin [Verrucomicrobia bacterium]|nr:type II toxin-antitoxin system VapC family toxin [Verrucomicrobiota bacterium]